MYFTSMHSCESKRAFKSKQSAEHWIRNTLAKHPKNKFGYVEPYYCERCGKWHTTSRIPRG